MFRDFFFFFFLACRVAEHNRALSFKRAPRFPTWPESPPAATGSQQRSEENSAHVEVNTTDFFLKKKNRNPTVFIKHRWVGSWARPPACSFQDSKPTNTNQEKKFKKRYETEGANARGSVPPPPVAICLLPTRDVLNSRIFYGLPSPRTCQGCVYIETIGHAGAPKSCRLPTRSVTRRKANSRGRRVPHSGAAHAREAWQAHTDRIGGSAHPIGTCRRRKKK